MGSYVIYPIVYGLALLPFFLIKGRVGFAFFLIIMFLFAALRGDVGNDACGYQFIYGLFDLSKRDLHFGRLEPVFVAMNVLLNSIGLSYQWLFVIVAGLQSIIYFKIFAYIKRDMRWLLVFLVMMYYYSFQFNTIRYGLAIIVFSLSFIFYLNGKNKKSFILAFIAMGIHVAVVPAVFLFRKKSIPIVLAGILVLSFYTYFIDAGLIVSKIKYIYLLLNFKLIFSASIDWFFLRTFSLILIIIFLVKDRYYQILFSVFILGAGVLNAFMPFIGRFSEAYVFFLMIYLMDTGIKKDRLIFIFPFLLLSFHSHFIYPLVKGDLVMSEIRQAGAKSTHSSGVKYHFFFEEDELVCDK